MKSFLLKIASQYVQYEANNLHKYCFVFPNSRAGLFFQKALKEEVQDQPILAPECMGMSDIFYRMSSRKPLEQIGLLCYLFKEYHEINPKSEFDSFVNLGKTLLHDFDEIDKYLANAKQIFTQKGNSIEEDVIFENLSEIQTKTITQFWANVNYTDTQNALEMHDKFKSLWAILYKLYTQFRKTLINDNKAYDGLIYREVIENIESCKKMHFKRYIFIGFNALNPCEKALLNYFKKEGKADFYFDYDSLWITDQEDSAGKYIKENSIYKSLYPIHTDITRSINIPKFECISVPSNIGQTKVIHKKLNELLPFKEAEKTAIILPDEALLMPLLHSLPDNIPAINITIGYPLNNTPIAALMEFIVALQLEKRGENFYHKNVSNILNHPYIARINYKEIQELKKIILNERKFELSSKEIITICTDTLFQTIFTPCKDINMYLKDVLIQLEPIIRNKKSNILEQEFFAHYLNAIEILDQNLEHHTINISNDLYFKLLKQITIGKKVAFQGEPIIGLQIMGMRESRSLDFDEIIMPSFNDDCIPHSQTIQSIIPYNLRRGFMLPTYEHYDALEAYNFYRLLQRCKKITLIYNSDSKNGGEISRYYLQLQHLHALKIAGTPPKELSPIEQKKWIVDEVNKKLNHKSVEYKIESRHLNLEIEKSDTIKRQLDEFVNNTSKHLSPSDIKTYISCPMQFYLKKIAGLYSKDELQDSIQANVFGSIYHRIMMEIYKPYKNVQIQAQHLKLSDTLLNTLLTKAFNIEFYGLKEEDINETKKLKKIEGYNAIIADVIKTLIKNTLKAEVKFTPFTYLQGELRLTEIPIEFTKGKNIYFKGFIDRIDKDKEGNIRIIDYKTGSDKEQFKLPIENIFSEKNISAYGAIVQTYLYCYMYWMNPNNTDNSDTIYLPQIYQVKKCTNKSFDPSITYKPEEGRSKESTPLSFIAKNMDTKSSLEYEFMNHLKMILDQIFNSDLPFKQTTINENCTYCDFKAICNR